MCNCLQNGITNCSCADNCPESSSDITLWDGTFSVVSVPAGSSLNEALQLLELYFINLAAGNTNTQYVLSAYNACLDLPAGTYSHTQMLSAIITKLCATATSLTELIATVNAIVASPTTTDVTLDGIVLPSCFSAFVGVTNTDLLNEILDALCTAMTQIEAYSPDPIVVTPPDPGQQADPTNPSADKYNKFVTQGMLSEVVGGITDNKNVVFEHSMPSTSAGSHSFDMLAMKAFVYDYYVLRDASETFTVNPSKDTYFYLSADGTILKEEVANLAAAPATPAYSSPLYKAVSDGDGITAFTTLFEDDPFSDVVLGADAVDTVNIINNAVTSAKMSNTIANGTAGHVSLFSITYDDAGRITAVSSNLNLAGIANGNILKYNSGTLGFEVGDNLAVPIANTIPKSNAGATDYEASSLSESTNQVLSAKKMEINSGAAEDDANAILTLASTTKYFTVPRMTAVQASAIAVVEDGAILYVTTTNGTFTSVGFWGMEATVWTKL